MKVITCVAGVMAAVGVPAFAQPALDNQSPPIVTHDNVRPAGRLERGTLLLSLRAAAGRWYPEGRTSRSRTVAAFGEAGAPLSIPAPLVRVAQGTAVQVTVHNALAAPLRVHGLCSRPGPCQPVIVPAGDTREVRFELDLAGTFHYWGQTSDSALDGRDGADSQLGGAIVVDPAGAVVGDRVFVLGLLHERSDSVPTELTVINGRSWPATERLQYRTGETVRWRIVNLANVAHPLHLHGFYFNVDKAGDGLEDRPVRSGPVVTDRVAPGGTRTFSWVPERPGNWLFHCHMVSHHVIGVWHHGMMAAPRADSPHLGMQGLVLGIRVTGAASAKPESGAARRRLQLIVAADSREGEVPAYRVDLVTGTDPAPRISGRVPGPVMVLTRGEPVAVEVVNRLTEPTAIHWHGIELESRYDGVPNLSGTIGSVTPPVAPGKRFTALFTPPRAGTFIYHSHWHDRNQLSAGVYGPLLVMEPGERYDPSRDHLIVIGLNGPYRPFPDEPLSVNGEKEPGPLELAPGVAHRLRFIGIAADNPSLRVQLLDGTEPIDWTLVAKDGAEVPPALRSSRPARQSIAVGETYDFELAAMPARPDGLSMELRRGSGELLFRWPVRVR